MQKAMSRENAALLYRNLASAARHELSFADLFAVLEEDPDLFSKKAPVVALMHAAFKEGNSLPDVMARVPQQFPSETVELVRSAEKYGQLPETLDLLADEQAWLAQTTKAIRGAIAWPLTVLAFAGFFMSVVMIFVIPAFEQMYSSFGADLPSPTLFVMGVSDFLVTYWWLFAALGIGGWIAAQRKLLPPWLSLIVERIMLFVPSIRNYVVRVFSFQLLGWLTLCVKKPGMQPLVLAHIKASTYFQVFRNIIEELVRHLNSGQALGQALDRLPPLPRRMALQVQIGEKTGNPENAIAQAIDALEAELPSMQLRFGRSIFLISYLLVGVVIGFTVIALYLPIFMMGQVV